MKRTIFTLIFAVVFSSVILPAEAALNSPNTLSTSISSVMGKTTASNDRQKKKEAKEESKKSRSPFQIGENGQKG